MLHHHQLHKIFTLQNELSVNHQLQLFLRLTSASLCFIDLSFTQLDPVKGKPHGAASLTSCCTWHSALSAAHETALLFFKAK